MSTRMIAGLVATVMMIPAAYAYDDDDDYRRNETTAYAEVMRADPITHLVDVSTPRQECWNEEVRRVDRANPAGGALVGGIIGAVIGHQIGHGSGPAAAGGVIGASIGAANASNHGDRERIAYEKRCRTVVDRHTEERTDGYDVTYRYAGQVYHTRMPYDPGRRMRVQVSVSPFES